jgi:predicted nucleic acid-binding protein
MNVLIDGNIILDVLQNRKPHAEASSKVWKLCETNLVEGYVSALTFADMVYVMRKELTPEMIQEVLGKLSLIFHFTELSISDLEKAAGMMWNDYEDAVQAATAERIRAAAIVTRNIKDYQQSKIPAFTPAEFLVVCYI